MLIQTLRATNNGFTLKLKIPLRIKNTSFTLEISLSLFLYIDKEWKLWWNLKGKKKNLNQNKDGYQLEIVSAIGKLIFKEVDGGFQGL